MAYLALQNVNKLNYEKVLLLKIVYEESYNYLIIMNKILSMLGFFTNILSVTFMGASYYIILLKSNLNQSQPFETI
jgi:hypothetical protein